MISIQLKNFNELDFSVIGDEGKIIDSSKLFKLCKANDSIQIGVRGEDYFDKIKDYNDGKYVFGAGPLKPNNVNIYSIKKNGVKIF